MLENRTVMETYSRHRTTYFCSICGSELESVYLESPSGEMICEDCVNEMNIDDVLKVMKCKSQWEFFQRYYGLNEGYPSEWED